MKAKHTAGPWKSEDALDSYCRMHIRDSQGRSITVVSAREYGTLETIANANLIAAGPDLLKALKDCLTVLEAAEIQGYAIDVARRTITEAEDTP